MSGSPCPGHRITRVYHQIIHNIMGLSEFERQRQANIERNKRLLSSLNLNAISGDISRGIKKEVETKPESGPKKKKVKTEKAPLPPTRRSRRIAGVQLDDSEKNKQFELEEDKRRREREELEKLKTIRVNGDLSLLDLVRDKNSSVKKEDGEEDDSNLLEKFQKLISNSKSFSIGDYYEEIVKKDSSTADVKKMRDEFSKMSLYGDHEPSQIKLTTARMTYATFHPTVDKKLVLGADHEGLLGVWNANDTDEVDITHFKIHGKSIAKLEFDMDDTSKVYTCSYDGSIRNIDLGTMKSTQVFINGYDVGITDINFTKGSEMYYTTMDGEFGRVDVRSSDHSKNQVFRLSNKKIGGFAVNPNNKMQLATASLDRTMKLFDLRTTTTCTWTDYKDELDTFHIPGVYDSRLSVSIASWNHSNDIVCNGYDDTVNIFQLGKSATKWSASYTLPANVLKPTHTIKHNCQTGRWVSILKARWHLFPEDKVEKLVIANMKKYFDVYDRDGNQLAHLGNPLMTNVPAVANFHHTKNWLIGGGASGKAYLFA